MYFYFYQKYPYRFDNDSLEQIEFHIKIFNDTKRKKK